MKLLLATHNPAKVREMGTLLEGAPFQVLTLAALGLTDDVAEGVASFQENARLKALHYAHISGELTLADDSGLEVEALGGEPGPLSRRYAGEDATDEERIHYLLAKLVGVPWERRQATFRCALALAWPDGRVEEFQGECQGIIALEPQGQEGFGYDPVFYLPELGRTMAQLTFEEKNSLSHRAKAIQKARAALERLARKEARPAHK
ncbi:MAG: RdgB/HAM1 family non-canonical purine NTP pyrophosphatase [Chloroflexi bacterium]|nr:RdgB/HAM1 family non-canonical purine NTP pyrophosphatase [Chloroflexota bacterium]